MDKLDRQEFKKILKSCLKEMLENEELDLEIYITRDSKNNEYMNISVLLDDCVVMTKQERQ